MNASLRGTGRQYAVALRALLIFTVVLGIGYPLAVTGIGQLVLPLQSNGSAVSYQGRIVGSSLIGQSFTDSTGRPLPQWFQSRPSAAGAGAGYDGGSSGGSDLGLNNSALVKAVDERRATIEKVDRVGAAQIPADALTASASGLDPHISPAYAQLQVDAVARARGISRESVNKLVEEHIQERDLGYLGEPTVNVLELNTALAAMNPAGNK